MPHHMAPWKIAGQYVKYDEFEYEIEDDHVVIEHTYSLVTYIPTICKVKYTVCKDGVIKVDMEYVGTKGLPNMPEFSLMFGMDKAYNNIEWYGYGPDDSYVDTVQGTKLEVYTSTAKESLKSYVILQDSGNKYGVRWMEVVDSKIIGFKIVGQKPLEIFALPYNPHKIEAFNHPNKLPDVYVYMGVGGDDSWVAPVLDEYQIDAEVDRSYSFYIKPVIN